MWNSLPQFLRDNGYVNPTDAKSSPWFTGHDTDEPFWDWVNSHPPILDYMLGWMQGQRDGLPIFLDVIDFKEFAQGATSSTPIFVDVGGARGHQCIALKRRYSDIPGRVVLQDQAHVIGEVKADPLPGFDGIEAEAHDIFTPQQLRGKLRSYCLGRYL